MGTPREPHMSELSCFVDEFLKQPPALAPWRHAPHAQPQFSEAEVRTSALVQGAFAVAPRKPSSRLVAQHWRPAFPQLPSYQQGLSRVHPLLPQGGRWLATTCTPAWPAARL
jgi:hypothetical protein